MSGEDLKVKHIAYKPANDGNGGKAPAAENKQAKPLIEGKKSVPGYLLDRIGIGLDFIMGVTPAYAQDTEGTISDKDLESLEKFSFPHSNDIRSLTEDKNGVKGPEIKNKNGKGAVTISDKTIIFISDEKSIWNTLANTKQKKIIYIDDTILPYFNQSTKNYPYLATIGQILSSLDTDRSLFNTPEKLADFFLKFQQKCNNYDIYAMFYEKGQYLPIEVDGKCGRQTARALVFVYELGQLAVKFQIVKSFDDYAKIFNGTSDGSLKFKDVVRRIQDIVTRMKKNPKTADNILKGRTINDTNGSIKGNVGDFIIELFKVKDTIKDADLMNIAGQAEGDILVLPFIKPEDAIQGTNYPAMKEAKKILCALGHYMPEAASIDEFDGTWDREFADAMNKFGTEDKMINDVNANKLFKTARDKYQEVKNKADTMNKQVQLHSEIPNVDKSNIPARIKEINDLYDENDPGKIAIAIIEMNKVISKENALLGLIVKADAIYRHNLLIRKYAYLKEVIAMAGDLVTSDEKNAATKIEDDIKATKDLIYDREDYKTALPKVEEAKKKCSGYIVEYLSRVFNKNAGEIEVQISGIDLNNLPADGTEADNKIEEYQGLIGKLTIQTGKLETWKATMTNEGVSKDKVTAAEKRYGDIYALLEVKRKEIFDMILLRPLELLRRELFLLVNLGVTEIKACTKGDELKKMGIKLQAGLDTRIKDDEGPVAKQNPDLFVNDITKNDGMKHVNQAARRDDTIVGAAINLMGNEEIKQIKQRFLKNKVTPELQRLIDAIDERLGVLNEGVIEWGVVGPVSRRNGLATKVMAARYMIYVRDSRPALPSQIIFVDDPEIPDSSQKVMPFLLNCYALKKNPKYYPAAKALYNSAVRSMSLGSKGITIMSFDEALDAEINGVMVALASLCFATVIAEKNGITVADKQKKTYNDGKTEVKVVRTVNKGIYDAINEAALEPIEEPKPEKKPEEQAK